MPDTMEGLALYEHQRKCLEISNKYDRYGFMLGTGTGKTRLGLGISLNSTGRTIILTKLSIINTWLSEARDTDYPLKIKSGWARSASLRRSVLRNADFNTLVMNYDSFKIELNTIMELGFDTLICDESSAIKAHNTKTSKAVLALSKSVRRCYLLSGSPAPNGEHEWYTQSQCLRDWHNGGAGPFSEDNFYRWQRHWFYQPTPFQPYLWKIDPGRKDDFIERLSTKNIFIRKEECIELPERIFETREVELGKAESDAYNELEKDWIIKYKGATTIAENVLVEAMKLRQITGGWSIPTYTDKTSNRAEIEPVHIGSSKKNVLREVLEELGSEQSLVFIQFRHEARDIYNLIGEEATALVDGSVSHGARSRDIEAFQRGDLQYLVGHPQAMAHGLNLQNASYAIWYSLGHGSEWWQQANDRIHRHGQTKKCVYITLLANTLDGKPTIDFDIYQSVQGKVVLANRLLERLA